MTLESSLQAVLFDSPDKHARMRAFLDRIDEAEAPEDLRGLARDLQRYDVDVFHSLGISADFEDADDGERDGVVLYSAQRSEPGYNLYTDIPFSAAYLIDAKTAKDHLGFDDFVPALVESWQDGVPEFRPRFAEWPQITEIVQEWGTKMMLGEVTTEEGAQEIGTRMEAVLDEAGYYDGKKPLAQ